MLVCIPKRDIPATALGVLGHVREYLADSEHRLFLVYSYLVVYLASKKPIQIVRVLHAARDEHSILDLPPDEIAGVAKDIDLYFGSDGRVPIGIDASFPSVQTAPADAHLAWAEMLVDLGLYYQAHEQLALLEQPGSSPPRAQWLRARLKLIQLHNLSERSRQHRHTSYEQSPWLEQQQEIKL